MSEINITTTHDPIAITVAQAAGLAKKSTADVHKLCKEGKLNFGWSGLYDGQYKGSKGVKLIVVDKLSEKELGIKVEDIVTIDTWVEKAMAITRKGLVMPTQEQIQKAEKAQLEYDQVADRFKAALESAADALTPEEEEAKEIQEALKKNQ